MCQSEGGTGDSEGAVCNEPCPRGVASPTRKQPCEMGYGKARATSQSRGQGSDVGQSRMVRT